MIPGPVPMITLLLLLLPQPEAREQDQKEWMIQGETMHYRLRYGPGSH
jgi:hypothetical protein